MDMARPVGKVGGPAAGSCSAYPIKNRVGMRQSPPPPNSPHLSNTRIADSWLKKTTLQRCTYNI